MEERVAQTEDPSGISSTTQVAYLARDKTTLGLQQWVAVGKQDRSAGLLKDA